jgi:hypothetical protein
MIEGLGESEDQEIWPGYRKVSNSQTDRPSLVSTASRLSLVNIPDAWVMMAVAA